MYVCMYVCMCVCVHVCLWVCMYICMCVYVSMYPRQLPTTAFNNWDSRAHASPSASVHSTKESKRNQSASRQHPTIRTTYSHSFQPKWAGHVRLLKGLTFQQRISIIPRTTLTASASKWQYYGGTPLSWIPAKGILSCQMTWGLQSSNCDICFSILSPHAAIK